MILSNPGPMWIFVTSPTKELLAPGTSYTAPEGTVQINWMEFPSKPTELELSQFAAQNSIKEKP